jgi:ubiquinone/menaquinone biosynthesis C-methylase UbiE
MGFYDRVIFPRLMHWSLRRGDVTEYRNWIVPRAEGRVLEVGVGSGLNLPLYGEPVSAVVGIDPHETLNRMAEQRISDARIPVTLVTGSAEDLPLEDASFDTAVMTWALCSIPDGRRALDEIRRVLKPGGQLLYIEHGQAPDAGVARWQDWITPVWKRCAGGCHLNRPINDMIREQGFALMDTESGYLEGPRFLAYCSWGRASR